MEFTTEMKIGVIYHIAPELKKESIDLQNKTTEYINGVYDVLTNFKSSPIPPKQIIKGHSRKPQKVDMYNLNGKKIKTFNSLNECSSSMHMSLSRLKNIIRNCECYNDYIFKYNSSNLF